MQKLIRDLQVLQCGSEQIKNFPFPRQYAFINSLFVWIMCVLLPFGMISEFEQLDATLKVVGGIDTIWLSVPVSLLIGWMYLALNQVVESSENPFEGGANDVPISQLCRSIEIDLLELMGETDLPSALRPKNNIVL